MAKRKKRRGLGSARSRAKRRTTFGKLPKEVCFLRIGSKRDNKWASYRKVSSRTAKRNSYAYRTGWTWSEVPIAQSAPVKLIACRFGPQSVTFDPYENRTWLRARRNRSR